MLDEGKGLAMQVEGEALKVSVIGCGYLGAVHAAAMAELGHEVVGLDVDANRIATLAGASAPFYEPGFEPLLQANIAAGRLRFTNDYSEVADADVHFLALGTPQIDGKLSADLSYVDSAISSLAPYLESRAGKLTLVVGKSTVPVGTARRIHGMISALPGVHLVWNPEFLREGFAVEDTLRPDRIVYGVADGDSSGEDVALLDKVYSELLSMDIPRRVYNFESSELVKVSANSFLATKISFINAISELCDITGADVNDVAEAIGMDDRIGPKFLRAGVGFGGGCLPKDLRGLISRAGELGAVDSFAFLRDIDTINRERRDYVVRLAKRILGGDVDGARVAILGAAFKPNTDDIRDSPALEVALKLYSEGARVTVTDPAALENVRRGFPTLLTESSAEEAVGSADLILLLTEWDEYKHIDPERLLARVARPIIIDGRNVLDLELWRGAGWTAEALGRP